LKFFFLLLVLINVAFPLWEWRSGTLHDSSQITDSQATLLLSDEAARARRGAFISGVLDRRIDDWQCDDFLRSLGRWQVLEQWPATAMRLAKTLKYPPSVPVALTHPSQSKGQFVCYEIGPFTDLPAMKKWLKQKGLSANDTVVKEINVAGDFQVYLPVTKNQEQLQANKQLLIAKGIRDFWVVPSGDNKGALSLGVFTDHQRALNFKSSLQSSGVNADVKQRFKIQQQFYAKVTLEKAKKEILLGQGLLVLSCSR
jgi:hypothetical protein